MVTVAPETVQTSSVRLTKVTLRFDEAVASTTKVFDDKGRFVGLVKVMVWVAVETVNDTLFVASRYRSSPDWVATSVH
jgi:hypothetical protein